MNCGIVTLYNSLNFGTFLQAFALKTTLEEELDCKANLVNLEKSRFLERLLLVKCKYPKRVVHHYKFLKELDKVRDRLEVRSDGFDPYDAVVIGSDELWNLDNGGFIHHPEYFGRGITGKRIVSYAVSSNLVTPDRFRQLTKNKEDFSCFDSISVRDTNTLQVVKEVGKREATLVVDPTLLMRDWSRFVVPCPKKDFILLYSMTVYDDERKAVEKLARETGKKIITIGCYNPWCDESIYATPFEFLGYVQAADYIITSQFHGVMFSTIFNKPFVIHPQKKTKVIDAMAFLGLQDRDVTGVANLREVFDKQIDYEKINQVIITRRAESLAWLKKALECD